MRPDGVLWGLWESLCVLEGLGGPYRSPHVGYRVVHPLTARQTMQTPHPSSECPCGAPPGMVCTTCHYDTIAYCDPPAGPLTRPYIGVTGVVTPGDLEAVRDGARIVGLHRAAGGRDAYRPMVGVLASAKTLRGVPTPSRRYPTITMAEDLLRDASSFAFAAVHYNTRSSGGLADELARLVDRLPSAAGVQLNVTKPDSIQIAHFHRAHRGIELILQLNRAVWFPTMADTAEAVRLAQRFVWEYLPCIRHVLIDASGGEGVPFAAEPTLALVEALACDPDTEHLRVGVAGGLGPQSGPVLAQLARASVKVSIDAEGALRVPHTPQGRRHEDDLEPTRVAAYLAAAHDALSRGSASWSTG